MPNEISLKQGVFSHQILIQALIVQTADPPLTYVKTTKQDKKSIQNFQNELLASKELNSLSANLNENPNTTYNIIHQVIQSAKAKHMPSKLDKFSKYKHKKSKWITNGIIKSIRYRDDLYKKLKMTDPNTLDYKNLKINLRTYTNILKRSIRLSKRNYYHSIFSKFKGDIKGTWKAINEILNKTKCKKTFPLFFKDGDTIIKSKLHIATKFNNFFTNVGLKLSRQIDAFQGKSFKDYLNKNYGNKFHFESTNETTVAEIIDKLTPKTSFGFDGVSSKLLKAVKGALIKPITIIINQIFGLDFFRKN